jgi:hypothetical protein
MPGATPDRSDKPQSAVEQLLSGLRELRSPLAAGYLWLFFGWLVVDPQLAGKNLTGSLKSIDRLGTFLGRIGIAISASVLAYLLGVVTEQLANLPFRVAGRVFRPARLYVKYRGQSDRRWHTVILSTWVFPRKAVARLAAAIPQKVNRSLHRIAEAIAENTTVRSASGVPGNSQLLAMELLTKTLHDFLQQDDANPFPSRRPLGDLSHADYPELMYSKDQLSDWLFLQVIDDLPEIPPRLLGPLPEIYGLVDRPRAEATFMLTLSVPLLATILLLSFETSFNWLLALPLPLWTYLHGVQLRRDTGALLIGLVQTNDFSFSWSRPMGMLDNAVEDTIRLLKSNVNLQ